jgi:hypothetical protein
MAEERRGKRVYFAAGTFHNGSGGGRRGVIEFEPRTVLKRDAFSETVLGHVRGAPEHKLVMRRLDGLGRVGGTVGWLLARREARALAAVGGLDRVPVLVNFDRHGLIRGWIEGTPLQLARPAEAGFYREARALLREMRRRGVTHNDLAKPQNWLMTPEGRPALVDFQLAAVSRRRGLLYRLQAYEDLRHLLKHKRKYAAALLTPAERRLLARRSLPSRLWMALAKPVYNFVTRRLMHWSDNEGAGARLDGDGPAIVAELTARPGITAAHVCTYPRTGKGLGLYGFVETALSAEALRRLLPETRIELLQPVARLPRGPDGAVRADLLALVAGNRLDEIPPDAARSVDLAPIIAGRLNLTDRY